MKHYYTSQLSLLLSTALGTLTLVVIIHLLFTVVQYSLQYSQFIAIGPGH